MTDDRAACGYSNSVLILDQLVLFVGLFTEVVLFWDWDDLGTDKAVWAAALSAFALRDGAVCWADAPSARVNIAVITKILVLFMAAFYRFLGGW